jgi:hypothetical protein
MTVIEFIDLMRAMIRPLITLLLVVASIAFIAFGAAMPDWFRDVVLIVVGFWFGTRESRPGSTPVPPEVTR